VNGELRVRNQHSQLTTHNSQLTDSPEVSLPSKMRDFPHWRETFRDPIVGPMRVHRD